MKIKAIILIITLTLLPISFPQFHNRVETETKGLSISSYSEAELLSPFVASVYHETYTKTGTIKSYSYQVQWRNVWNFLKRSLINTALAAVGFDTSSGGNDNADNTLDFSHTSSGTNRIMIVGSSAINGWSAEASTYAAVSLGAALQNETSAQGHRLYRLINPNTGTNTVSLGTAADGAAGFAGWAVTFTGADQTQTGATDAKNGAGSGSPTLNITSTQDNSYLVSAYGGTAVAITPGDGATEFFDVSVTGNVGRRWAGSYRALGAAGAQTVTWTPTVGTDWGVTAVEVIEGAGGGGKPRRQIIKAIPMKFEEALYA